MVEVPPDSAPERDDRDIDVESLDLGEEVRELIAKQRHLIEQQQELLRRLLPHIADPGGPPRDAA